MQILLRTKRVETRKRTCISSVLYETTQTRKRDKASVGIFRPRQMDRLLDSRRAPAPEAAAPTPAVYQPQVGAGPVRARGGRTVPDGQSGRGREVDVARTTPGTSHPAAPGVGGRSFGSARSRDIGRWSAGLPALAALLSLGLAASAEAICPCAGSAGDCTALADLYAATRGAGWADNTGWCDGGSPCSWHGVTSCGSRSACADRSRGCPGYAARGYCRWAWVKARCPASCNLCYVASTL